MNNYFKSIYGIFGIIAMVTCSSKNNSPNPINTNTNSLTTTLIEPFTASSCGLNQTVDEITKQGWVSLWQDEFDTNLKDWKKWIGGAFNGEYQYYNGENNLTVKDGILTITPKLETITGLENPYSNNLKSFNFTSGRIESGIKFSPKGINYNSLRLIARIKTPSGIGMWPAFWAYGDAWPTNGEIDILEQNGGKPHEFSSTYHYGTSVNADQWAASDLGIFKSQENLTNCWHIIECIWEKDKISYIFDGKEYFVNTGRNVPQMWDKMQNVALNLAIGGNYVENPPPGNIQLNPMYVDWVRVYSKQIN